jgi:DNA-binding LytR/AlgR family response regulator
MGWTLRDMAGGAPKSFMLGASSPINPVPGSPPAMGPPGVCLVVDHQPATRDRLVGMLRADARVGEVLYALDAFAALRLAHRMTVDVAFIEVELAGIDGVELAGVLQRFAVGPAIILVTRDPAGVVDAVGARVVDCLPRPFTQQRLDESLRQGFDRGLARRVAAPCRYPDGERSDTGGAETIAVPTVGGLKLVRVTAIRWAQAEGDHVRLHTNDGNHLIRASISWLADRLASVGMVRIHRSFLVQPRLMQMTRREHSGGLIAVIDGHRLPVSRRRAVALRLNLDLVAST